MPTGHKPERRVQLPWLRKPLTDRQRQILALIAAGKSNPEIARELYLSRNTVKAHVRAILYRLGARNRIEALTIARAWEMTDESQEPKETGGGKDGRQSSL